MNHYATDHSCQEAELGKKSSGHKGLQNMQNWSEFVKVVHEPFIALCDDYFHRKEEMLSRGWTSFTPILDCVNEFSLNRNQINELEKYECELCKTSLGKLVYESELISELYKQATEKYRQTNNWLDQIYPYAYKAEKKWLVRNRKNMKP